MAILNNNPLIGSGGQQGYSINNSLRFRGSATAYLSRTPASAGNRKTWTWSAWIKLGTISVNMGTLLGVQGQTAIYLNDGTTSSFRVNGAAGSDLITSLMPRDPSAWYHLVVACDTTQATDTNRLKIYVNGVQQTAFQAGATYPTLNGDTYFNSTSAHYIGRRVWNGDQQYDGYIAEQYLIDGSQKAASDFGETDTTTGVWKPKAYTGTYGTNGFYLKFSDIATTSGSNAGLGKDFSGNSNYWTTNNISVTSGTTYDAMTDSPTNTSATVANYCTLNPLSNLDATTLAAANLNFTQTTGASSVFGTIGVSSGKYYWEVICQQSVMAGVADTQRSGGTYPGAFANSCAWDTFYTLNSTNTHATGTFTKAGTISGSAGTAGQVIGVALDMDAGTIVYYINGSVQNSGNAVFTNITGTVFPVFRGSTTTSSVNFGQRPFAYTPPTGFVALNTFNLPDSTIKKGNSYMDATLFTATGTTQTITNDGGFQPDLVWQKSRSASGNHFLNDAVRGASKYWNSNVASTGETTNANFLTSFNSNGFSMGSANWANTTTVVGWQWKAGNTSGSSNTNGTRTSTVTTNTTAGFSVLTYTGNSTSGATVGHGLGVAPRMIILKRLANTPDGSPNSIVYHASIGNTGALVLDLTVATQTSSIFWNNTSPTSSVFSVGNDVNVNGTGYTYVAYCWAEISGFSRFGSYTGNGSTDGPFIATNFAPKWIMIKRTNSTGNWYIWDSVRSPSNVVNKELYPNLSNAEATTGPRIDILANGFKFRDSDVEFNGSGSTYIYAAFAEIPFRNSLAR